MSLERPLSPPTTGSDKIFEAGAESLGGEAVDEEVEGTACVKVGIRKVKCRALCLDPSPVHERAEVGKVERDVDHFAWVVIQVLGLDKKILFTFENMFDHGLTSWSPNSTVLHWDIYFLLLLVV